MYGKWKSINKENQEENIVARKFKVGDKVKIILKDDGSWNKDVTSLIGKTVTIKAFHGYASYKIYEDNGKYPWNNHDFKLVEKEENNTMRYKVGDKVILRSDLKEWKDYGEYALQDDIKKEEEVFVYLIDENGYYKILSFSDIAYKKVAVRCDTLEKSKEYLQFLESFDVKRVVSDSKPTELCYYDTCEDIYYMLNVSGLSYIDLSNALELDLKIYDYVTNSNAVNNG